ncbi:hypothetical protein AgCh_037098 [Apium graveolens]
MESGQEYDHACAEESWYNLQSWVAAENVNLLAKDQERWDQTRYEIPLVSLAYVCASAALAKLARDLFKADRKLFQCLRVLSEDDTDEYLYYSSLL